MKIQKVASPSERTLICNQILRALPSWFGIESAIVKYATDVATMDTWAIFFNEKAIGFISINLHNESTAEIHVMGILEEFHNEGYGRKLIETVEDDLINRNFKFLTVKTLSASHPDQNYAKTRKFYLKMGFTPFEEFKTLWNENNPCLLLVKSLYEAPKVQIPKLSHIEINVSNYSKSIIFYDTILLPLGWTKLTCTQDCTSYSDGFLKIILSPTLDKFKSDGFHRKRVGLNHIALSAKSAAEVNDFYQNVLIKNSIACLYERKPSGDESYFAVFFEDPDRIKIELVSAPDYCKPHHWTNQFESNYDPSGSSQKLHIDELKKNQLRLIEVGIEHAIEVQVLFENSPTYFLRVSGNKPSSDEAIQAFQNIPKINSHEITKLSFLVYEGIRSIGYIDLLIDYPEIRTSYLGLLILKESEQRGGLGRRSFELIEYYLRQRNVNKILIGVSDKNSVHGFWEKMGFKPNGKVYPWNSGAVVSNVCQMEKCL